MKTVLFTLLLMLTVNQAQAELLWSNKKSGGDDWMTGTIHLGDERLSSLPQSIKSAIDSSDVVVIEVDLTLVDMQQQQSLLFQYAALPQGVTLNQMLSEPVYNKAKQYFASYGVDIAQFAQFKPWLVALTMVQMSYTKLNLQAEYGLDQQIQAYAKQQGKKVVGLESYAQQINFFNVITQKYPEITGDDLILDTLQELKDYADLPHNLINAWLNSNLDAFEKVYQETLSTSKFDEAAEQVLIVERNYNWQETLEAMFAEQKVFVAVGSLHFVGSDSLPVLLDNKFDLVSKKAD